MNTTGIAWADYTWNPFVGCSKISPACDNCYAEKTAARLANMQATSYYAGAITDGKWNGNICTAPDSAWQKPFAWKKPKRIFVGSMTDVFHQNVPVALLDKLFMEMTVYSAHHSYLILTKRPERMLDYITTAIHRDADWVWQGCTVSDKTCPYSIWTRPPELFKIPANVWLGVTAENQEQADARIPILLDTPAAKRFVSIEPMLGPVDLELVAYRHPGHYADGCMNFLSGAWYPALGDAEQENAEKILGPGLDWVIAGGESGPGARPSHPDWFRSLRDQCKDAWVPFFFKQWGEWGPVYEGKQRVHGLYLIDTMMYRVGKKAAGHLLDGQEWRQFLEASHA